MSQIYVRPFSPRPGTTQTLVVTTTSQPLTLVPIGTSSIRVVVSGTQTIYWEYKVAAQVTVSVPMLANTVETFLVPNDATSINFIAAATGSTVFITLGDSA